MSRRDPGKPPHDAGPPSPRQPDSPRVASRTQPKARREIIADPEEEPKDDPLTRTEEDSAVERSRIRWMGMWGVTLIVGLILLNLVGHQVTAGYHHVLTALFAAFTGVSACRAFRRHAR